MAKKLEEIALAAVITTQLAQQLRLADCLLHQPYSMPSWAEPAEVERHMDWKGNVIVTSSRFPIRPCGMKPAVPGGSSHGVSAHRLHGCEPFNFQNDSRRGGTRCPGLPDHLVRLAAEGQGGPSGRRPGRSSHPA